MTLPAEVFGYPMASPGRLQRIVSEKVGSSVSRLPTCSKLSSLPISELTSEALCVSTTSNNYQSPDAW